MKTALDAFSAVYSMAPFVIAAYAAIWATLIVFVGLVFRRLSHIEREIVAVEESVARRQGA